MYGAFKALEQIDAHQSLHTVLTPCLREIISFVMGELFVFLQFTRVNIAGGSIDTKCEVREMIVYFTVIDGVI